VCYDANIQLLINAELYAVGSVCVQLMPHVTVGTVQYKSVCLVALC
jgi:hypothetical protein